METSVAVLVDAKREYTNQLIQAIRPFLLSGMLSIYDEAFNVCQQNKETDLTMLTFQELLGEIPKWNNKLVVEESERIVNDSNCDYLDDLLTAVFVCHTKILTTVRVTNKDRKINLKIPCVENFLHQVYIEMAREFWKHPYLLNPLDVSKLEYQQNLKEAENIIHQCLETTIRRLLPVKDILKEYLVEEDTQDDVNNDEFTTTTKTHQEKDTVSQIGGSLLSKIETTSETTSESATKSSDTTEMNENNAPNNSISNTKSNLQKQLSTLTQNSDLQLQKEKKPQVSSPTNSTSTNAPTRALFDQELAKIENGLSSPTAKTSSVDNVKTVSTTDNKSSSMTQIGGSSSPIATNSPTKQVQIGTQNEKPTLLNPMLSASSSPKSSPLSSPITSLSLDSLGGGGNVKNSGISSPLSSSKQPSSPTSSTSEISLDNLGGIQQVHVDFGMPSSSPSSTSVKKDVLGELNTIASTPPSAPSVSSLVSTPAPAPAPFQFF